MTGPAPLAVALTAATSFAGDARVRAHWGYRVRALTRRPPIAYQKLVGVTWIHGELTDPAALDTLVAGADVRFHVAARFRTAGSAAGVLRIARYRCEGLLP